MENVVSRCRQKLITILWFHVDVLWGTAKNALKCVAYDYFFLFQPITLFLCGVIVAVAVVVASTPYFRQSQTKTVKWTNHNAKKVLATSEKRGKTSKGLALAFNWMKYVYVTWCHILYLIATRSNHLWIRQLNSFAAPMVDVHCTASVFAFHRSPNGYVCIWIITTFSKPKIIMPAVILKTGQEGWSGKSEMLYGCKTRPWPNNEQRSFVSRK